MSAITRIAHPVEERSAVAAALHKGSLGVPSVLFFALSAVGPLQASAGVIPTFFGVTGLTSAPIVFVAVAVVLAIFAGPYVAMARRITNAGAFYAFIARGLGRPAGVAGALVATLAYNLLQFPMYGMFGPVMSSWAADNLHIHLSWYVWVLIAWVIVTILGQREIKLSARVLAVLSIIEIAIVVVISIVGLAHPAGGHADFSTLSPTKLVSGGVGAAGVMCALAFIGFEEAPVFGEEARNPRRTVAIATYVTLGMIAVVYVLASLAMTMHYGSGQVAAVAGQQGPEMLFSLAGSTVAAIARILFLTSMFAALLAYHNAVGRYMFSLGREAVLPKAFGRTSRSGSPWVSSLTQSLLGLAVVTLYAVAGWDPTVNLFFWLGTTGGFGILLLLAATSVAVIVYFARNPHDVPFWQRTIAPAVAFVLLATMVVLALNNYSTLLGVAPGSLAATLLPASYLVPIGAGLAWALILRARDSSVYAAIGLGPEAAALHPFEVGR